MSPKQIKVLHVLVCLGGGGVETLLLNLQERLPEHITFDYLVAHPAFRDKEARAFGSTVHLTPPEMRSPTRWAAHVGQLVSEHHYAAVHFHRFAFGGSVLKAAKRAGARLLIAHRHSMHSVESFLKNMLYYPYHWTINRWLLLRHATHIVGCSSDVLRLYMGPFAKHPKCRTVLNGIIVDTFADRAAAAPAKAELCKSYGIPPDTHIVGTFGRMDANKNHTFLLNVFDLLAKRNRNNLAGTPAILFIGGEGLLRSQLEQERERLSLSDRVFFPGQCANVPESLSNLFDCFVLPSKTEGLPVSIIEAVAAGLHVVCSDVITKDLTDTFQDRITALPLSAPLERWADAIESAVQRRISPEQGLALIRNSPMTFDNFANEIIKIYEGVGLKSLR
ncbi:MAG: glycosyltransferase [Planctomycetaceae bacterium]|nr:glycosyltransferase [Planctomycetaceae bacterium]